MWKLSQVEQKKGPGAGGGGGREKREGFLAGEFGIHAGFEADGVQSRVLTSTAKRGILCCTRQWGKSTVSAMKAAHHAFGQEKSLTLVVSPTMRQSGELVRKAAHFAADLGVARKGDGSNEMSLQFPNGSRIIGLPGNEGTIRGFSAVSLLLIDEAARVDDELYLAVRPMLAVSAGALWLMSTPFGKRGFFYESWHNGGPDWERVRVTGEECTRIPREFLGEERREMGERWFGQEYLCEFTDVESGVFDRDVVERAFRGDVPVLEI